MKKFLDNTNSIDDLKKAIIDLKKDDNKKILYIFFIALFVTITAFTIYFIKKSNKNKCEDDYWNDEWDNEFEYDDFDEDNQESNCDDIYSSDNECNCCEEEDFDKSVKVDKL